MKSAVELQLRAQGGTGLCSKVELAQLQAWSYLSDTVLSHVMADLASCFQKAAAGQNLSNMRASQSCNDQPNSAISQPSKPIDLFHIPVAVQAHLLRGILLFVRVLNAPTAHEAVGLVLSWGSSSSHEQEAQGELHEMHDDEVLHDCHGPGAISTVLPGAPSSGACWNWDTCPTEKQRREDIRTIAAFAACSFLHLFREDSITPHRMYDLVAEQDAALVADVAVALASLPWARSQKCFKYMAKAQCQNPIELYLDCLGCGLCMLVALHLSCQPPAASLYSAQTPSITWTPAAEQTPATIGEQTIQMTLHTSLLQAALDLPQVASATEELLGEQARQRGLQVPAAKSVHGHDGTSTPHEHGTSLSRGRIAIPKRRFKPKPRAADPQAVAGLVMGGAIGIAHHTGNHSIQGPQTLQMSLIEAILQILGLLGRTCATKCCCDSIGAVRLTAEAQHECAICRRTLELVSLAQEA